MALESTLTGYKEHLKETETKKVNVEIGNTITLTMQFVDVDEEPIDLVVKLVNKANPVNSEEVTLNSPLGTAIYHKGIGDKVKYKVNNSHIEVEILNIV